MYESVVLGNQAADQVISEWTPKSPFHSYHGSGSMCRSGRHTRYFNEFVLSRAFVIAANSSLQAFRAFLAFFTFSNAYSKIFQHCHLTFILRKLMLQTNPHFLVYSTFIMRTPMRAVLNNPRMEEMARLIVFMSLKTTRVISTCKSL